jgi:hypothetical protein
VSELIFARDQYPRVLNACRPWLACTRDASASEADPGAFGFSDDEVARFDPQSLASAPFLDLVQKLDERVYEPQGMRMPRWVFYDCAAAPGGLFGFAQPAADVDARVRSLLDVPDDYEGLVPLSAFLAIPMLEPHAWQVVGVLSVERLCPGAAPTGVERLTSAFALAALGARTLYGTAQWRAPELSLHATLAPLEILSAWTPAHDLHRSLVFRAQIDEARLTHSLTVFDEPPGSDHVDVDDDEALQALQARIEAGARVRVVAQPVRAGPLTQAPIEELAADKGRA